MNQENINSNKCPICGRSTHKTSKYCIFHALAEEKTEDDFKKALEDYLKDISEHKKNYNFKDFIFIGHIEFRNVDFRKTRFWDSTFYDDVDFLAPLFIEEAIFSNTIFKGKVNFIGAVFQGYADFRAALFEKDTNFYGSTFQGAVYFEDVTFLKDVDFRRVNFLFKINFNDTKFVESINFFDSHLLNAKIKKSQISNHIYQEKINNFSEAKEVYLLLKNNFHSTGRYNDESWARKKENDMERKSFFRLKQYHKWLCSCFLNAIYGYGERPLNVVISALVIILAFTLAFSFIGIGNPEIIELQGKIYTIPGTDIKIIAKGILQNTKIMQFSNSLYFSLITFTTLGYGDFRPLEGLGRILAGSEAFIGAFMMALFVYTFARRTGGR